MDLQVRQLGQKLQRVIGVRVVVSDLEDDTYVLEGDCFTLTCCISETIFEIRSIKVYTQGGVGRKIITVIHWYADHAHLQVVASNVRSAAIGFWERMGYTAGSRENEYFRIV